jgi:hypothetical protein
VWETRLVEVRAARSRPPSALVARKSLQPVLHVGNLQLREIAAESQRPSERLYNVSVRTEYWPQERFCKAVLWLVKPYADRFRPISPGQRDSPPCQ